MDGFAVAGAALLDAAEAATEVALGLPAVGVAAPFARLAVALPGSAVAAVADELALRWHTASQVLATAIARHGADLTDTAAHYAGTDSAVAGGLGATG